MIESIELESGEIFTRDNYADDEWKDIVDMYVQYTEDVYLSSGLGSVSIYFSQYPVEVRYRVVFGIDDTSPDGKLRSDLYSFRSVDANLSLQIRSFDAQENQFSLSSDYEAGDSRGLVISTTSTEDVYEISETATLIIYSESSSDEVLRKTIDLEEGIYLFDYASHSDILNIS